MIRYMNQVNLIGQMSSLPKVSKLSNGKQIASFTLATKEHYLDKDGRTKIRRNWHLLSAWGRWVKVLEEFGQVGIEIAIEGKLVTRFYHIQGKRRMVSEVEVSELIIM